MNLLSPARVLKLLMVALFLFAHHSVLADEVADGRRKWEGAARAADERYLQECPAGEIRGFWYLDDVFSTSRLKIDLGKKSTFTERAYYFRGLKNQRETGLADAACRSLEHALRTMPDSDELRDRLDGLSIAWRSEDRVEIRRYKRSQVPAVVRRIYDLGGGELAPSDQEKVEALRGRIIIPPLNRIVDGRLPMKLELKNTGRESLRLCTLCMTWPHHTRENVMALLTPDSWKSDPPGEEEIAKHVISLQPGATLEIPFELNNRAQKKLRIEARLTVAPDFARRFDLWSGEISCPPVILVF